MMEIHPVVSGDIESELSESLRASRFLFPLAICSVQVVICRDDQLFVCQIAIEPRPFGDLFSQSGFSDLKILRIDNSTISFDNIQNTLGENGECNGIIFGPSACDTIMSLMNLGMIKAIWENLEADSYVLFLTKSGYFSLNSYLFFRKIRFFFPLARCYTLLINPFAKDIKFISVKYRIQRNYIRSQTGFNRKFISKLMHAITSSLGLYPWLERRHAVVARKC